MMETIKKTARFTGLLYLAIFIFAGFAEGFVRSSLIISGDATATANNIMTSEGLFRLGFVSDLMAFVSDAIVSILLYVLLKPVSRKLSLIAASLRLLAHPAIASLNLLNHFFALHLLSGADYLTVFSTDQLNAMVLLFFQVHNTGYLIAGVFFGFHLFILGYLLYKSDLFPSALGFLVAVAASGYLVESFGSFLFPAYRTFYIWIVGVTAVIGELSLTLWLLIKGVRNHQPNVVN
jgi:uncharacterized membrane protein (UPF0136 family)